MNNNRAITLHGANKIFEPIGIAVEKHPMGFYQAEIDGKLIQRSTLTEVCQTLVKVLRGSDV